MERTRFFCEGYIDTAVQPIRSLYLLQVGSNILLL